MLRYRKTYNLLLKKKCEEKQICMGAILNIEIWHVVAYVYCSTLHLQLCRNFKSTLQHRLLFDKGEDCQFCKAAMIHV